MQKNNNNQNPHSRHSLQGILDSAWSLASKALDDHRQIDALSARVEVLGCDAFRARLAAISARATTNNPKENIEHIRELVRYLAQKDGQTAAFSLFKSRFESQLAGIVLTAHPTFGMTEDGTIEARRILSGETPSGGCPFGPPESAPTLDQELTQACNAIANLRHVLNVVYRTALEEASVLFPNDWRSLTPEFLTLASWVGFDLDGRTDIGWEKSVEIRYSMALDGLASLRRHLNVIATDDPSVAPHIETISDGLTLFETNFSDGMALLQASDNVESMAKLNRLALERRPGKNTALADIDAALDAAVNCDLPKETLIELATLRAEWRGIGLGSSHIHFRLNAAQLHNAVRAEIGLEREPDKSATRRLYLESISELLRNVEPVNIHYGTLLSEKTTARRLFMLAAQFEKHFDGRTPIRLLVAESDTPFTLLTALYFARLFSVEDHVEISPLFETAVGLKRGDRVIAELLDNPNFLDYIKNQGRFCVQLGFSDSGRYIGQPAATLAIERFKLQLVQLWRERGLEDVQLLFFDTHGESIGRGAHPASLTDRFLYTHSAKTRHVLDGLTAPHKHEVSFQGGDGFLWFATPDLALACVTDLLSTRIAPTDMTPDIFYEDQSWSLDFFLSLTEFQDYMLDHPGYAQVLNSFAAQLLFPTGSRAVQRKGASDTKAAIPISSTRAIPHNARLQQLGYMANTLAGMGTAIARAPERFHQIRETSDRLGRIGSLIEAAEKHSDVQVLAAYMALLDPDHWLDIADQSHDEAVRAKARNLSRTLERSFDYSAIASLVRKLRRDAGELGEQLPLDGMSAPLRELHEIRLALIHLVFLKALDVPRFSSRLDISLDDLVLRLLQLDIPDTIAELRKIFPATPPDFDPPDFGEETTFGAARDYKREDENIFKPLEQLDQLILKISAAIAHEIGAVG